MDYRRPSSYDVDDDKWTVQPKLPPLNYILFCDSVTKEITAAVPESVVLEYLKQAEEYELEELNKS